MTHWGTAAYKEPPSRKVLLPSCEKCAQLPASSAQLCQNILQLLSPGEAHLTLQEVVQGPQYVCTAPIQLLMPRHQMPCPFLPHLFFSFLPHVPFKSSNLVNLAQNIYPETFYFSISISQPKSHFFSTTNTIQHEINYILNVYIFTCRKKFQMVQISNINTLFLHFYFIYLFFRVRGREGGKEGVKHGCERETSTNCLSYTP